MVNGGREGDKGVKGGRERWRREKREGGSK